MLRLVGGSVRSKATSNSAKAPWAMVPLKPNELRRDVLCASPSMCYDRVVASTGMQNDDRRDDATDDTWAFNLRKSIREYTHKKARISAAKAGPRSCALTTTMPVESVPTASEARPAAAAAASR